MPDEFAKYYGTLFQAKTIDPDEAEKIFDKMRKKQLLPASRSALEKQISEDEVLRVMENLPIGKSAGPDRIPNALYQYMAQIFAGLGKESTKK